MEILATLASAPGAPAKSDSAAAGGDDPFLALLAGLMQQPALPGAPTPIRIEPAPGGAIAPVAAPAPTSLVAPAPTLTPMPTPVAVPTVAPDDGQAPVAASVAPRPDQKRSAVALPDPAAQPTGQAPVVAAAVSAAPPASVRAPKRELTGAETATAELAAAEPAAIEPEVRPKCRPGAHHGEPVLFPAAETVAGNSGQQAASAPPPSLMATTPQPERADPAPARTHADHALDLPIAAPDPGAAPMPAAQARAVHGPSSQPWPPIQLPTPDHRGRPVMARLVLVDGVEGSRVRIDLEPADLGRVEVALRLDDSGSAAASFTVDRPETLQLLQRDARAVNEMLSAAGFTVDRGGLDFSLRDPGGRSGGGERQPEQRGRAEVGFGAAGTGSEPPPVYRRGLLDLRV